MGGRRLFIRINHRGNDYGELVEVVLSDLVRDGGWVIGPFLLVSILTVLSDPPSVLVRDHGPGIPPEMRPMLF